MAKRFHLVILGADRAVGRALAEQAQDKDISFHAILSTDWDLTNLEKVQAKLAELEPTFLINCMSPGDGGTTAHVASVLAQACSALKTPLVQLSSNHVFQGQEGQIFKEEDEAKPATEYGLRVLAIENAVRSSCRQHLLLRVGWLFSSQGEDDVARLLKLAQTEAHLRLSDTKVICPTSACDIAAVLLAMVHQARFAELWGTYQYCSAEQTTLFKFAEVVAAEARQYEDLKLQEITSDASDAMNRVFSETSPRMSTKKILYTFGVKPKPWRQALSRILKKRYAV